MKYAFVIRHLSKWFAVAAFLSYGFAAAQSEPTVDEIYAAARAGDLDKAQKMVTQILVAHPNSAKAHFVQSELFAHQGNSVKARDALATAEKLAPGLPFAKPEAVKALRSLASTRSAPVTTSDSLPTAKPKIEVNSDLKIKALALTPEFLNSTLFVNYLGSWQPLAPCAQWLGKLFNNENIASIDKHYRGKYPGISIKVSGRPAIGLLFRMEGKEAYIYGYDQGDDITVVTSPADHSSMAVLLQVYASGKVP